MIYELRYQHIKNKTQTIETFTHCWKSECTYIPVDLLYTCTSRFHVYNRHLGSFRSQQRILMNKKTSWKPQLTQQHILLKVMNLCLHIAALLRTGTPDSVNPSSVHLHTILACPPTRNRSFVNLETIYTTAVKLKY